MPHQTARRRDSASPKMPRFKMSSVLSLFSKIVLTSKKMAQSKTPDAPTTRRRSAPDGSGPLLRTTPAPYLSQQNLLSDDVVKLSETDNSITRRPSTLLNSKRPSFFQRYKIVKRIGEGQFGEVFAVRVIRQQQDNDDDEIHHQPATGMKASSEDNFYACKIIDIATSTASPCQDETLLDDVMQEISMMMESTHPNVQNLVDFSIENNKAYIVSSLCRGGDLAQALKLRGCLCEEDAKAVMAGIFRGLSYLHSRGIAHRDIKLENILFSNSSHDMSDVRIIDMGFAKKVSGFNAKPGEAVDTAVCGTPFYIAPELIKTILMKAAGTCQQDSMARFVGTQADMWSCGVILYNLLSGYLPFDTDGKRSMMELFEDIKNAAYDFSDPVWSMVSDEALSLVESLLQVDPSKRLTAEEALRHPWMAI